MKKPIFGVDFDEVLAYCEQPALDRANEKHGTNYTTEDITKYGVTGNDIIDEKFSCYADPEFVKNQPLYEGAKEFIAELRKRCDVVFITAVNDNCLTERSKAIQREFNIDPKDIILTSRKDLFVGKFLLDDCADNIRKSKCEYPILFRRPWNRDVSGAMSVTRYEDVLCFVDYILGKQNETEIKDNSIICLVGPTGSGKTEMMAELCKKGYKTIKPYKGAEGKGDRRITAEKFTQLEKEGFFAETTVYGGVKYGISNKDVAKVKYHEKYAVVVDICGAMALRSIFGSRVSIVFCSTEKEKAIENIIERDISNAEKVIRINGLEAEYSNSRFCDYKIRGLDELLSLIEGE